MFPNAIQRLSNDFPLMKADEFENISKNLMTYIQKDKHVEYIINMLCNKLKSHANTDEQANEWRNSSFCLT